MTNQVDDQIVEEIRRRRQAHAESFDYDLKRIAKDLQRQEQECETPVVQRPPREAQALPKRSSA